MRQVFNNKRNRQEPFVVALQSAHAPRLLIILLGNDGVNLSVPLGIKTPTRIVLVMGDERRGMLWQSPFLHFLRFPQAVQ